MRQLDESYVSKLTSTWLTWRGCIVAGWEADSSLRCRRYSVLTVANFINILQSAFSSKNYKAQLQLEKSCTKHLCTYKNPRVKCWWNWHLFVYFSFFRMNLTEKRIPTRSFLRISWSNALKQIHRASFCLSDSKLEKKLFIVPRLTVLKLNDCNIFTN